MQGTAARPVGRGRDGTATPRYPLPFGAMTSTRPNSPTSTPTEPTPPVAPTWTVDDSKALYNIDGWGAGFFDVSEKGRVIVRPDPDHPERTLDLFELGVDLEAQGMQLPILLRFSDILRRRIETLSEGFEQAIKDFQYGGGYTTVYPIKVNQQRHVVEEIVEFGRKHGVGLECGSKPELQAVLGLGESTEHIIVCNGYKDEEFMRLALMGQKLGHQVFIVLEQVSELDVLLAAADELGVQPSAGVRIKLAAEGSGRWAQSGGEKSKFGLNAAELVKLIDRLKELGRLDILKLVHFHLGSQITDIRYIKSGLAEIARFYQELHAMGVQVTHVDVGGGLGVDYDGTNSTNQASVNYTLQEYAADVIYTFTEACRVNELPMPHIISESGRALTAHHALLLLRVTEVESQKETVVPELNPAHNVLLHEMAEDFRTLTRKRLPKRKVTEIYHDASFDKDRAQQLFNSGVLSLRDRAMAESIYQATINRIAFIVGESRNGFEEITKAVEASLVDRYFCNFSLFQSLPDSWAIDQLFPIIPIHRLDERPDRRGTLQDMTRFGRKDRPVYRWQDGRNSLELHAYSEGEDYILGIFLTGAYQEILGDLHNLFGDTNAVHIRLTESGYEVTDMVHGDTVTEVLNYVQFSASNLLATFRRKVANARDLTRNECNAYIAEYVAGLEGYTYLEGEAAR
jgi:arginine decarboxylase